MNSHEPCQLYNITQFVREFAPKVVVDCTAGEGGHALTIANILGQRGKIVAIEIDPVYFQILKENTQNVKNLIPVHSNYINIQEIVATYVTGKVDAVLFDFGMSSFHLEQSGRGFSYRKSELLDLRFNPDEGEPLYKKLWKMDQNQIEDVLRKYGESRFAKRLAHRIYINQNRIRTTEDLNNVIRKSIPQNLFNEEIPKIYQAFRIFTNNELENILSGLYGALRCLNEGGIILTIAYHSLEDRICKSLKSINGIRVITKKPLVPSESEISENPRCRSSKLRVFQKEEHDEESIISWYRNSHSLCAPIMSRR
ncbi:MAG TPA: 16S rRNA (cytosine(1402)-N(4))-methyltransferase RsmH [Candidatus Hydrothermia bacterium]|nr:16S rRNA (cytosine(1402)-N(4))-methyltransferase RsmH [Candidatus Hydrothermia bacterium]MDD5572814.1 16S rRNA (cytosine(1402)-N(4))-methyltransferase RsmH [Candidatus Hydrothermia bacterium]HOP32287.1 16S rRNA (cytosine(1402)-N(4))-methyltransferase RsmH [Candidatus Hydrothermia bacterium]HRD23154.1 16S rRNA (cytosine(1402)-N(4))-methyltransferase RsmH [Candidatus Hydrothermia bacterium]